MRFFNTFTALIAIATLAVAAPHSGVRDVMNDIDTAGQLAATLREHVSHLGNPGFNVMTLMNDNKAINTIFELIIRDATAVGAFDEADASEIITRTGRLADQIEDTATMLISKKGAIPTLLHGAVVNDLRVIMVHAKAAGDALIADCPADKKAEAMVVYSKMGDALMRMIRAFSS